MSQQQIITLKTSSKSFTNITEVINKTIIELGKTNDNQNGLCNLFIQHTSCSLIISENYDKDVLRDLESFMSHLVPEKNIYRHDAEGKDDMPAHIRSVLTQTSITIPVRGNKLALGTWQAVYLWEHRDHSHSRQIVISIFK